MKLKPHPIEAAAWFSFGWMRAHWKYLSPATLRRKELSNDRFLKIAQRNRASADKLKALSY